MVTKYPRDVDDESRSVEIDTFPQSAHCEHFQATFELIGKKWTAAILRTLFAGCSRFTEILRSVPGLSNRLLADRLEELRAEGLVVAHGRGHPVYTLTEKGRDLRQTLADIEVWNRTWLPDERR